MSPRGGKLPPLPRYGERFTAYLARVTGIRRPGSVTDPGRRPEPKKRRER